MKIDVSPDMPMYNLLKSYPYDLSGALSEYIDNSLQAYLDAPASFRKKFKCLEIKIDISLKDKHNQYIKVFDNGVGISATNLQKAMKPGFVPEKQTLHEFGIGMKAASVWLGREWHLQTVPFNGDKKYRLDFKLDELIRLNQKEVNVTETTRHKNDLSGVEITINKLRDLSTAEVISACIELHDTYQIFIYREKKLKLSFTLDETSADLMNQLPRKAPSPLNYPNAQLLKPTWSDKSFAFKYGKIKKWKKNINFKFNGLPVKGFISVRKEASQTTNPGLALFRYKRLIQGSSRKPYRPKSLLGSQNKAAPSKIYMELHLDGQPISHTKGKFNFDEQRFLSVLSELPEVKEFKAQAQAHRPSYEDRNEVVRCTSKEKIKEYIASQKEIYLAQKNNKNNKNNITRDNSTKNGKIPESPVSPMHHNGNWDNLLPQSFSSTSSAKLNSLLVESNSSMVANNPYSSCFLLRTIIERCLFQFVKHHKKISDIINWEYNKRCATKNKKGEDISNVQKIKKPGIEHMSKWLTSDNNGVIFGDDEKDCISSLNKTIKHVSTMNGVVHQEDLTNAEKVKTSRDDSYPLLQHILNIIAT